MNGFNLICDQNGLKIPKDRVAALIGWLREEKHLLNTSEGRMLFFKLKKLIENTNWYEIVFPTSVLTEKEKRWGKEIQKLHDEELKDFERKEGQYEYFFNKVLPSLKL